MGRLGTNRYPTGSSPIKIHCPCFNSPLSHSVLDTTRVSEMYRYFFQAKLLFLVVFMWAVPQVTAQHGHVAQSSKTSAAPKVFLDKSPKIVEYQLKRLTNEQLLLVERTTTDLKYAPVFSAILSREGMPRANRDEALSGLVALRGSDPVSELASTLQGIQGETPADQRMVKILAALLLELPPSALDPHINKLTELAVSRSQLLSAVGYAALVTAGRAQIAWDQATGGQALPQLLTGITMIPKREIRNGEHGKVLALLSAENSVVIQQHALQALATITSDAPQTFLKTVELLDQEALQAAVFKTLLSIPANVRDQAKSRELIGWLVDFAENTPVAQRTSDSFLDAMELVEQLLADAPSEVAKPYRARLRDTVVRVVRIHTVEEEMRYDLPFFAVEAGRPVQVVLINDDIMPHNLVLTSPGALQEIADAGLEIGPTGGLDGKQYVPHNKKVLQATNMVAAREQAVLTFNAPNQPGEYPYVCTFPRHWMRMYGVMVVVEDFDAWQKNPVQPKDPIGSNRHFVHNWSVDDFKTDLPAGLRGRSQSIGEKLFVEGTCAQCHKLGKVGVGNVGPDLSQVFARWKGDPTAVLREILDPSHRIDDKYAVHIVITLDGQTISGLIVEDTKDALSMLENPEAKQPRVISKQEIDEMQKTPTSMMPKGLLDRYSKDEILEIVAYIESLQQQ